MAEAHKKAYRHPKYKTSYRIKNWSEYEQSLRNRGDITVWLNLTEKRRGVVQQLHQCSLSSRSSYCRDPEQGMGRVETSVWILFTESRGKCFLSLQENHWRTAESQE